MSSKEDTGKGGVKIRLLLLEFQECQHCGSFVLARGAKRRNFFFRKGRLVPAFFPGHKIRDTLFVASSLCMMSVVIFVGTMLNVFYSGSALNLELHE